MWGFHRGGGGQGSSLSIDLLAGLPFWLKPRVAHRGSSQEVQGGLHIGPVALCSYPRRNLERKLWVAKPVLSQSHTD